MKQAVSGWKARPRTIADFYNALEIFTPEVSASVIAEVKRAPIIDDLNTPDEMPGASAPEILSWHLSLLAQEYRWQEIAQHTLKPKAIATRTRKVANLCRQIQEALTDEDGTMIDGLGPRYLFASAAMDGKESGAEAVARALEAVADLKRWALVSADRADSRHALRPPPKGRERDVAFHMLIERLGGIYYLLWRSKPGRTVDTISGKPGGPYFRFVRSIVLRLAPEWSSETQIDGPLSAVIAEHVWHAPPWE